MAGDIVSLLPLEIYRFAANFAGPRSRAPASRAPRVSPSRACAEGMQPKPEVNSREAVDLGTREATRRCWLKYGLARDAGSGYCRTSRDTQRLTFLQKSQIRKTLSRRRWKVVSRVTRVTDCFPYGTTSPLFRIALVKKSFFRRSLYRGLSPSTTQENAPIAEKKQFVTRLAFSRNLAKRVFLNAAFSRYSARVIGGAVRKSPIETFERDPRSGGRRFQQKKA